MAEFVAGMADHIDMNGWIRNRYGGSSHAHCIAGAARCFLYENDEYGTDIPIKKMDEIVHALGFNSEGDLIIWNDTKVTSKSEAVDFLRRKSIEIARST